MTWLRALLWSLLMAPSLAASAWVALWLQWMLPTEDGPLEAIAILAASAAAGIILGVGRTAAPATRFRWGLRFVVAACVVSPIVHLLLLPELWKLPASMFFSLATLKLIAFFVALFATPGVVTYVISRLATQFAGGLWQAPLAVALVPLFVVTATLGASPNSKWCWPWSSFRPALVALQSNAVVAMDRLQLPRDRALTKEELERWRKESPLRMTLRFPITHWEVVASVVNPWTDQLMPDGGLWMWWGDKTFGAFDLKRMRVLSASD